jgi:hypothetical protein
MQLTRQQAAIIGAYTGVLCGPFADVHETIERVIGRPVFTHEMANEGLMEEVRKRIKPEFLALAPTDTEGKDAAQ